MELCLSTSRLRLIMFSIVLQSCSFGVGGVSLVLYYNLTGAYRGCIAASPVLSLLHHEII